MKKISKKLTKEFGKRFLPFAEQLKKEGSSDVRIKDMLYRFIECERVKFYNMLKGPYALKKSLSEAVDNWDSKIELIYCRLFSEYGIPHKFQYKIGTYRADFLLGENIVFEIDGPQHDKDYDTKRDSYMERMGYKVLRVPAWLAASSYRSVIEEIQNILSERKK